jgi:hypothetical protein
MSWRVTCSCAHWIAYAPTREIAVSLCEQHQKEQPREGWAHHRADRQPERSLDTRPLNLTATA